METYPMRNMILAGAAALAFPATPALADHHMEGEAFSWSAEQEAAYDGWPADRQPAYAGWPAEVCMRSTTSAESSE